MKTFFSLLSITALFTVGTYIEKTMNLQGNFCTRWDGGSYEAVYDRNFQGSSQAGNKVLNRRSGLRTRSHAYNAQVPTCTDSFPTFGI
jgi:hypothetical protein